ncbi:MAG: hypothetical protein ACK44F_14185 [Roseococcus sp.]
MSPARAAITAAHHAQIRSLLEAAETATGLAVGLLWQAEDGRAWWWRPRGASPACGMGWVGEGLRVPVPGHSAALHALGPARMPEALRRLEAFGRVLADVLEAGRGGPPAAGAAPVWMHPPLRAAPLLAPQGVPSDVPG